MIADNSKWSKRFSSIVWGVLTFLPFIILIIGFIVWTIQLKESQYVIDNFSDYIISFNFGLFNYFEDFSLPFINDMMTSLFDILGVSDLIALAFAWAISVQFYHLIFDFICWLPKLFHKWYERSFD